VSGLSERDVRELGKYREGFEELGEIANAVANPPPGNKKELDDGGGYNMKGRHNECRASGVAVDLTRVIDVALRTKTGGERR
jgi:hypothetical protein